MIKRNLILLLLTLTLGVVIFNSPLKSNSESSIYSTVNDGIVLKELLEIDNFTESKNITVLNLWASWCIPCQNEVDELKKISLNENFQVIGILVDDSVENGNEFIVKNNIPDFILCIFSIIYRIFFGKCF